MFHRVLLIGLLLLPVAVWGHGDVTEATHARLRAAMEGGGLVRILTTNVITLTNAITISEDTTIEGILGAKISGGNTTRIFVISTGVTFRASDVAFIDGAHLAGTQYASGENSHMVPSTGLPAEGGAISAESAEIHLVNCRFERNKAIGGAGGHGTRSAGGATGPGKGGALALNNVQAFITNCWFRENRAHSGDANTWPPVFDSGEVFIGSAKGGAISATGGTLTIVKCEFSSNLARTSTFSRGFDQAGGIAQGAALYADQGVLDVSGTVFTGNSAESALGMAEGGALWVSAHATINQSVIAGNGAINGAGIFTTAILNITNSTLYSNFAVSNGFALFVNSQKTTLAHSTILSIISSAGMANVVITNGGAVAARASIFDFVSANQALNASAPIEDLGYNISSDSSAEFTISWNNTSPMLQAWSISTQIRPTPDINSPAVDAVPLDKAPAVDQLGFPRSIGGKADIGAREVGPNILHWQHSSGRLAAWVGNSDFLEFGYLLWPLGTNLSVAPTWKVVQTADFNGDATRDLLWRNDDGRLAVWPIANLRLSIQGTPVMLQAPVAPSTWRVAGWLDLDGDSDFDLWWEGPGGTQGIWVMDGNSFSTATVLSHLPKPGDDWQVVKVADFNGDNAVDLLWQSQSTGRLAIWHLDSQRQIVGTPGMFLNTHDPVLLNTGPSWKVVSVVDYDMDGAKDLIWQFKDDGVVAWWGLDNQRRPVPSKMKLISNTRPGKDWRLINVVTP